MKGVLDILHAWKNVLNKSFEQKREYRFVCTTPEIIVAKNAGGHVTVSRETSTGRTEWLLPSVSFVTIYGTVLGSEVIVTWEDDVTALFINDKRIV